jgi:hypothetical protein
MRLPNPQRSDWTGSAARYSRPSLADIQKVGLMTQLGTVSSQICLKSSEQTFVGTKIVCRKTCVTTVVC